jgi:SAM-dependent methyltransferase
MEINSEEKIVKWREKRQAKAFRICNVLKSIYQDIQNEPIILDVGCHEGVMDQFFAKFTNNLLIGIDISFNSLKIGRCQCITISFRKN